MVKTKDVASEFIGIEIDQNFTKQRIELHQSKHIQDAVDRFALKDAKAVTIPIDTACLKDFNSELLKDAKHYQSLVGTLNYICSSTRPDICFAVNHLATKAKAPSVADLRRAKRCLVYLRETKHLRLRYKTCDEKLSLTMYVDASYASGKERRSIYGFVIFLNKAVIHYKTKQQAIITLSSTEAEFVALVLGVKELKWMMNLIEEIGFKVDLGIVYRDNQGALKIIKNEGSTARTKHVDVRLQYLKQQVSNGNIEPRYVNTKDQIADIFTKPLGRLNFERLKSFMLQA